MTFGQRAVQQLLAVETEQGTSQAADAEQEQALQEDRPPQFGSGKALQLQLRQARAALGDHVGDRRGHGQHRDDEDQRRDLGEALKALTAPRVLFRTVIAGRSGSRASVDRPWLGEPHALDPEYLAKRVEVTVVVQDTRTALGGCSGDQVVRSGDAPVAAKLA
jgi:hypothetical protein